MTSSLDHPDNIGCRRKVDVPIMMEFHKVERAKQAMQQGLDDINQMLRSWCGVLKIVTMAPNVTVMLMPPAWSSYDFFTQRTR